MYKKIIDYLNFEIKSINSKTQLYNIIFCFLLMTFSILNYGKNITSMTVDTASHYSLVHKIFQDWCVSCGYISNLGEMAYYPPGAHYLASVLNIITGSGLISMNIINLVGLFLVYYLLSSILLSNNNWISLLFFIIIVKISIDHYPLPLIGLEVVNNNFLFGQFISTIVIISGIFFLVKSKLGFLFEIIFSIVIFATCMYIHAAPALLFFSGSMIFFVIKYLPKIVSSGRIFNLFSIAILIYFALIILIFKLNYYTGWANNFKNYNGHLYFKYFSNTPTDLSIFCDIFLIFLFVFCLFIHFLDHSKKIISINIPSQLLHLNSFLLGAVVLTLIERILNSMNILSPYVVKKNLFEIYTLFSIIISLGLGVIFLRIFSKWLTLFSVNGIGKILLSQVIFITIINQYWSSSADNLIEILNSQRISEFYQKENSHNISDAATVAQFQNISPVANWMISISELKLDKEGNLSQSLLNRSLSTLTSKFQVLSQDIDNYEGIANKFRQIEAVKKFGQYAIYSQDKYFERDSLNSGQELSLANDNSFVTRTLAKGFWFAEPWGTWTASPQSEIRLKLNRVPSEKAVLTLTANAWITDKHKRLHVECISNNQIIAEMDFFDGSLITDWTFSIPKHLFGDDGSIDLLLKFSDYDDFYDQQVFDKRILGLGLRKLKILYD